MDSFSAQIGEKNTQRRSQRVLIGIPISVDVPQAGKRPISEETRTLVVNAHGALVLLAAAVSIGDTVTVRNPKTNEELQCRVAFVGLQQADKKEVGVEFVKPSPTFWRIAFPPEDWTPRSEDAKGPSQGSRVQRPAVAAKIPLKK
jgi:hypothetical protein